MSQMRAGVPQRNDLPCQVLFFGGAGAALVKKSRREKVRKMSKHDGKCYVNGKCIIRIRIAVENPCGQLCGKCGKVRFFHREIRTCRMRRGVSFRIIFCIFAGITGYAMCYVTVRKRKQKDDFSRKSLQNGERGDFCATAPDCRSKKFVKNSQSSAGIICRAAEIMEADKKSGGRVCPERLKSAA